MASPPSELPEGHLDQALEAIFDAPTTPTKLNHKQPEQPSTPSTPPPTEIPQTPEPSPKKPPQKSILEHLVDNRKRLSAGAARIAQDLSNLAEANNTNHDKHASRTAEPNVVVEHTTHHNAKKLSIAEEMTARRTTKKKQPTKNAFTVVGRDNRPDGIVHGMKTYEYIDHKITNMSLTEAPYEKSRLEAIFEHTPRLDIADIKSRYEELRIGALKDYAVFGCLVKKIMKKSAKNGKMYAVWSLCNMPRGKYEGRHIEPTVVRLLLFDDAYETLHTRCEGTVFAFRKPGLLPRREGDHEKLSQHAMRISKKENVVVLGVCKDFKLCEMRRPGGELCGNWYDANRTTSCTPHLVKRRKAWMSGTRMDIQNAVRPNVKDLTTDLRVPADISAMGMGTDMERTEMGALDRKRKLDAQHARNIKRRHLERAKNKPGIYVVNVPNAVKKKPVRPDTMASVARETRQVRNQPGERHARLLGRSDRQSRYHEACEILYGLGFKLCTDGGWEPPQRCDVALVTTRTHKFNGLGKVKRRRGGELTGLNQEDGSSPNERRNDPETCEDDKKKTCEKGDAGETEQREGIKIEVYSGKANKEAEGNCPQDVESMLVEKTKPKDETLNKGMHDQTGNDKVNKNSLDTPSSIPEVAKPQRVTTGMNDGETCNEASQESSDETRTTPPAIEENDSEGNAKDIVLSDESEDE